MKITLPVLKRKARKSTGRRFYIFKRIGKRKFVIMGYVTRSHRKARTYERFAK